MALRRRGGRSRPVRAGRGRPRPAARDLRGAPALDNAAVQRLELALVADRRAIATNHLELTILPQALRPAQEIQIWAADELADRIQSLGYQPAPSLLEADVAIASALDESLCAAIRGGARVVLLADASMELQPIFPHWQAARWCGEAAPCGRAIGSPPSRGCGATVRSHAIPAGR